VAEPPAARERIRQPVHPDRTASAPPYGAYRRPDGTWRPPRPEGLARVLAKAGYGARPRAEQLVRTGRVTVAGRAVRDPGQPVRPEDEIPLDGAPLREVARAYLVLHKPRGVDCQERHHSHRWVGDLLPGDLVGLEPAGRLDTRARGLLLVSNDLWWNARVAGSEALERRYEVVVRGQVNSIALELVRGGVSLPSQGMFRPQRVRVLLEDARQTVLEVVVRGGHHRQVRAVFTTLRHDVLSLSRTGLGPVDLGELVPGAHRALTATEVSRLVPGGRHG